MNRVALVVAILLIALFGVWGCSQGPNTRAALIERIRNLEEKATLLEDDLRVMTASRDQSRQHLARAEEHIQKLQLVVKERDELHQLKLRMGERDQVSGQYQQFRNSIKDLVGQADSTVLRFPDGEPVSVSITVPPYNR